jgi:hypothetical protein
LHLELVLGVAVALAFRQLLDGWLFDHARPGAKTLVSGQGPKLNQIFQVGSRASLRPALVGFSHVIWHYTEGGRVNGPAFGIYGE